MTEFIENEEGYFRVARHNMVKNQIMPIGVTNQSILDAFDLIPKQLFVSEAMERACYTESAIEVDKERKILDTRVLAKMINACNITKNDSVLDIGCGFGYSSMILSQLAKHVVGLEDKIHFVTKIKYIVTKYNIKNCIGHLGYLSDGFIDAAPFSVIFINGSFSVIPQILLDQLTKNGKIVLIESDKSNFSRAVIYTKIHSSLSREEICLAYPDNVF